MGTAIFWMVLVVVAAMPILGILGMALGMTFGQKRENTQKRVQMMKEIVTGIRMIKYYAWEAPFSERLFAVRMVDLKLIVRIYLAFAAFFGTSQMIMIVMPVVVFYVYIQEGKAVTVSNLFTTLYIIGLINQPVQVISNSIQAIVKAMVSLRKVKEFLALEDETTYVSDISQSKPGVAVVWQGRKGRWCLVLMADRGGQEQGRRGQGQGCG